MSMTYANRMTLALLLSVLLHVSGLGVLHYTYEPPVHVPPAAPEPMVLDLQPEPEPAPPRQLVDIETPAPVPPAPTDRIAEEHAEAMDLARRPDDERGPALEPDSFDALPNPPAPEAPPQPEPTPPPREPEPAEKDAPETEDEAREPDESMDTPLASEASPEAAESPAETESEEPMRVAQVPPAPPERPSAGRSRDQAGAPKHGVTNFDAIRSEIAPYLKQVRRQVERRWNEMLYTRYSGTSPVKAVIDCAINPEGELVSVTVVGSQNDPLYSALCKDAVQRAGPFGPFPFEVPEIYRDKNLEIRWTFNFL